MIIQVFFKHLAFLSKFFFNQNFENEDNFISASDLSDSTDEDSVEQNEELNTGIVLPTIEINNRKAAAIIKSPSDTNIESPFADSLPKSDIITENSGKF